MQTPGKVNIAGLNKASVLQALFRKAEYKPEQAQRDTRWYIANQGETYETYLTHEEAEEYIQNSFHGKIGYLHGRVLKIDLSKRLLDTTQYNICNGKNAAEKALCKFFHEYQCDHTTGD